jgi:hypothetical protein
MLNEVNIAGNTTSDPLEILIEDLREATDADLRQMMPWSMRKMDWRK